ncbi:hypothetical protein HUO13_37060 [Saccharopolyspora erythraea]|uniref:hypothetical protein n=1 Tax=Saccharopolyspora erythraea TaxID=1836 RepID=UPI001BAAC00D|nr:hypothetical protein [Saccharopolyspora erythraea]QUH05648.1 hypothetical protein HUO13_37060 [Saccharopolyspora erythraea]
MAQHHGAPAAIAEPTPNSITGEIDRITAMLAVMSQTGGSAEPDRPDPRTTREHRTNAQDELPPTRDEVPQMHVPIPGEPVDTSFADQRQTADPFHEAEEEHRRSRRFHASYGRTGPVLVMA